LGEQISSSAFFIYKKRDHFSRKEKLGGVFIFSKK